MIEDITGLLLAGGSGSRLGGDKLRLELDGRSLLAITAELLRSVFAVNLVSANDPVAIDLPVVADLFNRAGPLAGIHAGLRHCRSDWIFVLAGDMPLMRREMIEHIAARRGRRPVVLCRIAGRPQPLAGLYHRRLIPVIEALLTTAALDSKGRMKGPAMHRLLDKVQIDYVDPTGMDFYDSSLFFNLNNARDLQRIKARLAAVAVELLE